MFVHLFGFFVMVAYVCLPGSGSSLVIPQFLVFVFCDEYPSVVCYVVFVNVMDLFGSPVLGLGVLAGRHRCRALVPFHSVAWF